MPRLGGLDLLQRLKERGVEIPTIMMSAHGSEQVAVAGFRLGIRDYVIKPFDVDEMDAAIDRALREDRLRNERNDLIQQLTETNAHVKRRLQELNILYGIGRSVSSALDMAEVLNRVVEAGVYVANADEGALLLAGEETGTLYVQATKNVTKAEMEQSLASDENPAYHVMTTRKPVVTNDAETGDLNATRFYSRIFVPLLSKGVAIGVLVIINRQTEQKFGNRDTRLLAALADYAAVAVTNSQVSVHGNQDSNNAIALLKGARDPILVLNGRESILFSNRKARDLLNLPEEVAQDQPISQMLNDNALLRFLLQPRDEHLETYYDFEGGDGLLYQAQLTTVGTEGRVIIFRDISHFKEIDRLKTEQVETLSQTLRSPLTSIMSYLDLLERAGYLTDSQQEYATRARHAVSNITTLIDDLQTIRRKEARLDQTMRPCNINTLLEETARDYGQAIQVKQLNLVWKLSPEKLIVMADRNRLNQAYGNMLDNAIKYSKHGGNIGIRIRREDDQTIIEISDNGIGIDRAEQSRVFERFYRSPSVQDEIE